MQQGGFLDAVAAPVADASAAEPEGNMRDSILLGDCGAESIDLTFRLEESTEVVTAVGLERTGHPQ